MSLAAYRKFLEAKVPRAELKGVAFEAGQVNPMLQPHAQVAVRWALRGGCRAIFAKFGLQKTTMQIEIMRLLSEAPRDHDYTLRLIVLPLGVKPGFFNDAQKFFKDEYAVDLRFIRSLDDAPRNPFGGVEEAPIYLTNYESVRDGKLDVSGFSAVSLDEASVLRGFGGTKTFREFMRLFDHCRFKFVATATPSPNEYIELLSYAAFLGIMDVGQAKTRFFKRNSEKADQLTLHPHKEQEFWHWVASWALFIEKPSDLGFSDEGYEQPDLDIRWHELPTDHAGAGEDRDGQARMFRDTAASLIETAREKRDSLPARLAKLMELRAEDPAAHRILWHDLEAERAALEHAIPGLLTVYGKQEDEDKEAGMVAFSTGQAQEIAAKPVMLGSGPNFQYHCAWAIFMGIGHKFNDFIQAIHRLQRYGQTRTVRLDLIYTSAEQKVRESLEAKWERDTQQRAIMAGIVRRYGLAEQALASVLERSIGCERQEVKGEAFTLINNDCVIETMAMADNSVDLITTSIPFSTQYEYTPSYNDFGHSDDDAQFWAQMDFLIPNLLRVLKPGRVAAIHVKDRIVPGGINGLGFQTVNPFSDDCIAAFRRHGFAFLARKTITTDVVRENNQTYRLGWSEQCKDGSRMGCGMPEYLLLFRKPPSDLSNGYADDPVVKDKPWCDDQGTPAPFNKKDNWKKPIQGTGYERARWQMDAHGYARSSGDRLLSSVELAKLDHKQLFRLWRERSLHSIYDFEAHVGVANDLDRLGRLPSTFMLFPPHSWHVDVWTDITRMLGLNTRASQQQRDLHLCPLQFDIVDRVITQFSMPGETVLDPFGGIGTVPFRAIHHKRKGMGIELSPVYFRDAVHYCQEAEAERETPSLFDVIEQESEAA